jgi:hypothetical protein
MVDENESLQDAILRILRKAGKCLTAIEIAAIREEEVGGGTSVGDQLIEATISKLPQVYKSREKYCLKPKHEDVNQAAARTVRETTEQ